MRSKQSGPKRPQELLGQSTSHVKLHVKLPRTRYIQMRRETLESRLSMNEPPPGQDVREWRNCCVVLYRAASRERTVSECYVDRRDYIANAAAKGNQ